MPLCPCIRSSWRTRGRGPRTSASCPRPGRKAASFPVGAEVFGACSRAPAPGPAGCSRPKAPRGGSRCSAGGRYFFRRVAKRALAARPDLGDDGSEPGPLDFGRPPCSGSRPRAGPTECRRFIVPRVPDQAEASGRALLPFRSFCREGEGESASQNGPRGGGLHRAFLALPLLRAVWRVRKAQRTCLGGVASSDLFRLDHGRQHQRRSRCDRPFGGLLGPTGPRPGCHHSGLAVDFAAGPASGALLGASFSPQPRGTTVFPTRRPKMDNLGSRVPSRDGLDRQQAGRDKGETQTAPGLATGSSPCTSGPGRARKSSKGRRNGRRSGLQPAPRLRSEP